jgi:hypothetical protein
MGEWNFGHWGEFAAVRPRLRSGGTRESPVPTRLGDRCYGAFGAYD